MAAAAGARASGHSGKFQRDRPIFTLELQTEELKGQAALLQAAEDIYGEQDPLPVLAAETIFTLKREAGGYRLTWSLPFADKADLDITQQADELVVGVENSWRRFAAS